MNKVYNIVYNEHTGAWVAVSEHQPKRGKSGRAGVDNNGIAIAATTVTFALAAAPVGVQAASFADSQVPGSRTGSVASGAHSVAIGQSTRAETESAIAIGKGAIAGGGINAIAIGNGTYARGYGAVSIGISNRAEGNNHAHAIGDRNDVFIGRGVAVGLVNTLNGTNAASKEVRSNALGQHNTITTNRDGIQYTNALGTYNHIIDSGESIAAGSENKITSASKSTAIGNKNEIAVNAVGSTAVGSGNKVTAVGGTALGGGNQVSGESAVAIGQRATASGKDSVALGSYSTTNGAATVSALKNNNAAGTAESQQYRGNAFAVLSVGTGGKERQIHNVAPGRVDTVSTDAVNGSQLYAVATKTGFNLLDNGGASKARINNDNTVKFVNGCFTTSAVSADGANGKVAINVVKQDIELEQSGKAKVAGNTAGVASAETVVNAINNSGFTLKANGNNDGLVKSGDVINFQQDKNINISKNGNTLTVKTVDAPTFTTVTANKVTGLNDATSDTDAVNYKQYKALETKIAQSKGSWRLGANGETTYGTVGQGNDIMRVIQGKNIKVERNANNITVQTSDSPEFTDVTVKNRLTTKDLTATGNTNLKKTTIDGGLTVNNGETKLGNLTVSQGSTVNLGGNAITNIGESNDNKSAATVKQVNEVKNLVNDVKNLSNKGTKYKGNDGTEVTRALGETLNVVGGLPDNKKNTASNKNTFTKSSGDKIEILFSDSPEFKNVTVTETLTAKNLTATGKTTLKETEIGGKLTVTGDTVLRNLAVQPNSVVNMGNNRITNVGKAQDKTDAVNYELLNSTIATVNTAIANSAWKLGANGDTASDVKAGSEVRVLQGRNIEVSRNGNNITVETVLNPVFGNLTAGSLNATTVNATHAAIAQNLKVGGTTTLQTTNVNGAFTANDRVFLKGDTTIGGAGKNLNIVEGTRIDMGNNIVHNVKAGTADNDAVNLKQMREELKNLNNTLAGLGMNFTGNNGEIVLRSLGSTLTVRGQLDGNAAASSKNIRTRSDKNANEIEILMADNPVFGNVTTQDLTVNGDSNLKGNTTIGGTGKNFNIAKDTKVNFGGNTVSNIGEAKNKNDAANLGQVEKLIANTTADLTGLGMNYAGDIGDNFKRELGSTVKIGGRLSANAAANSDNVRTRSDPQNGTVLVEFALNPVFGNVTTQDLTVNGVTNLNGDSHLKGNTTIGGTGKNFNIVNGTKVDFGGNTVSNIGEAKNAGDATNLGQVQNLIAQSANATQANLKGLGMKFQGDNGEVVLRPLGETLAVRGDGKNITTKSDPNTNEIKILLAENPEFGNVSTRDLTVNGDTNLKGNTTVGGNGKAFNVAGGTTVNMGGNVITNIGAGDVSQNSKDAVNGSQLYQLTELVRSTESKLTDSGMNFAGNSGTVSRKLGQTLEIVGAGSTAGTYSSANIRTQASNGKVEIQMADSPVLKNLQVDGSTTLNNAVVNGDLTANGNVTVGGQGKHLTVAEGTTVNLNGNSITNIQPGTVADGSSDVITGGQLYQVANRFGDGLGRLAAHVEDVDKDLRGGVAGAVASSLLPQAMNPAERLVAVSAGTYRGASALAVGYSQVTDNGKYIVKFAGSVNNRKHVSAGVAVGYRF